MPRYKKDYYSSRKWDNRAFEISRYFLHISTVERDFYIFDVGFQAQEDSLGVLSEYLEYSKGHCLQSGLSKEPRWIEGWINDYGYRNVEVFESDRLQRKLTLEQIKELSGCSNVYKIGRGEFYAKEEEVVS